MTCTHSILMDKNGVLMNPNDANLPLLSGANSILFNNEISFTFYNQIEQDTLTGLYIPVSSSVRKTGLAGTIEVSALPEKDSPYLVPIKDPIVDISKRCWVGFSGLATQIAAQCTGINGANYINMKIFRS